MSRLKLTRFGERVVEEMHRCPYAISVREARRRVKERDEEKRREFMRAIGKITED